MAKMIGYTGRFFQRNAPDSARQRRNYEKMRLMPGRAALWGALFAALVTLPGLAAGTLWDNSETVYGEVAREVSLSGDWIVMHHNGAPWFVQPPLYFWLGALMGRLFGIGEFALRLPSALATIIASGVLGYAVARVRGAQTGIVAAVVLATSLMQAVLGRLAIMDALLDLSVTVGIICWFAALEPNVAAGPVARAPRSAAFLCGTLALAFGTLAKGPVAPVIALLVIGVWLAWETRLGERCYWPSPALIGASLAGFALVVLPWFVAVSLRVGPHATAELLGHYTIGRYTGVIESQSGPWWYYVPVVILGFFPWIAFLPVAARATLADARTPSGSLARLALVWAVVPFVFFSCAQTKLPNYVALLLPALAIGAALWFERLVFGREQRAGLWSAATLPIGVMLVGIAMWLFARSNQLELAPFLGVLRMLGVGMLGGTLLVTASIWFRQMARWTPFIVAATSGGLMLFIALIAEPRAEAFKPIPAFAHLIGAHAAPGATLAVRGVSGAYALIFYTHPGVRSVDEDETAYLAAMCPRTDLWLVTRASDARRLLDRARDVGRHTERVSDLAGDPLLHIDGPACRRVGPLARR
jgi:4-amino-4-deoxy-L-arabinose transferase-like glycosyltransferase